MVDRSTCLVLIALTTVGPLTVQGKDLLPHEIVAQNFNTVVGGGHAYAILNGSGYGEVDGWDDGITGEWAYVGTWGDCSVGTSYARGLVDAGVDGSGAGNLTISQAAYSDGGWVAGLFWPDLLLPTLDPAKLSLRADVAGTVLGGAYQLRLEAIKYRYVGLHEDFNTVTGNGGSCGGPWWPPWPGGWDTGIEGEYMFAFLMPGVDVWGSICAYGMPGGGVDGSGGARIVVDGISCTPSARWFAGLLWPHLALTTDDLTQVHLTANVKGTANQALGERLGDYRLQIEDVNMDWIAFHATANRSWQAIGGPLSEGTMGGMDDGVFDVEAGPFTVILAFDNYESCTWGFGGTLAVDNLILTTPAVRETVGSVSFSDSIRPGFRSVGGLLSQGVSTFKNIDEDFEFGTGTHSTPCMFVPPGSHCCDWDDGLEGESACFGYWGDVNVDGGMQARTVLNGGVDGGKGAELTVEDVTVFGAGGWWAALTWKNQLFPERELGEIFLRADVRGVPGSGGKYHLRIEDAEGDFLGFVEHAEAGFRTIGGPLSDATEGTFIGHGTFNRDHPPFTVAVAFYDEWTTWGSGGTLIVDNVFLTAPDFGTGAEAFSVVLAFEDEVDTWGSGGMLTVDNLSLVMVAADSNDDGDADLADFARFQNCFAGSGAASQWGCQHLDFDGDNDVDASDYSLFCANLNDPGQHPVSQASQLKRALEQ